MKDLELIHTTKGFCWQEVAQEIVPIGSWVLSCWTELLYAFSSKNSEFDFGAEMTLKISEMLF